MYYVSKWKSWLEESDRWSLRRIDLTEGKGGDHCVRHCCACMEIPQHSGNRSRSGVVECTTTQQKGSSLVQKTKLEQM